METKFDEFKYRFESAIKNRLLDKDLIYSDEFIKWAKDNHYEDVVQEANKTLMTRSYPSEILSYVNEVLKYLYNDSIPKIDTENTKQIPTFLLKT